MDKIPLALVVLASLIIVDVTDGSNRRRFDRRPPMDPDALVFPDSVHHTLNTRTHREEWTPKEANLTFGQMPLDLARTFNDVQDMETFINRFVANKNDIHRENNQDIVLINARQDFDGLKPLSEVVSMAKPASCIPEMTVVPLVPAGPQDSGVFHVPSCTRVPRCGGCCSNHLLSCQPTLKKTRTFKIYELTQKKNSPFYKRYVNVDVEEHVMCKCDCVAKETDCSSYQEYNRNECRCVCANNGTRRERECVMAGRLWNPASCSCECPFTTECSTGAYFDSHSCSCKRK